MRGGWCDSCGGPRFRSRCIGYCVTNPKAGLARRKRPSRADLAKIPEVESLVWRAVFEPGIPTAQWRAYRMATNSVPVQLCLHDVRSPAHRACTRPVVVL